MNPFIFQIALIVGGSLIGYILYYRESLDKEEERRNGRLAEEYL
ncbi:MAG: hypothetical protein J07AB43_10390 [Candidatus Nanosalina sp. J07AB43]|nr:MAG: hypothetical protein J07AB43_10390 [Candidatus Nanosalina sp. J07AB43]